MVVVWGMEVWRGLGESRRSKGLWRGLATCGVLGKSKGESQRWMQRHVKVRGEGGGRRSVVGGRWVVVAGDGRWVVVAGDWEMGGGGK